MFCPKCGCELNEGASFCRECGAPVRVQGQQGQQTNAGGTQGKPSKRALVIVLCAVAVLVVALAGFLVWRFAQQPNAVEGHAPQGNSVETLPTYAVTFSFVIPEYDEATSSPVPVLVEGTDAKGNEVSKLVAATPKEGIDLTEGTYSISVAGSPVNGEGKIYSYSAKPVSVTLDGTSNGIANPISFELTPIAAEDVSDQQIQGVRDALVKAGVSQAEVDAYCEKARLLRQRRLDEIEAERKAAEEAERKAAEEAERKAAEEAERRENPAFVDGANSAVTLKGTLVREEWPTSKTQMGWSAVGYFLELETPVEASILMGGGASTEQVSRIQVASVEQYGSNADENLSEQADPNWEQYVGDFVAIEGKLVNQMNAHCLAIARFDDPQLVEVM